MSRPRQYPIVLTGPAAAAEYQLDGFRDLVWPHRFTTSANAKYVADAIRTDLWQDPVWIGGQPVAALSVVCNQLGRFDADLMRHRDLAPIDRVELAVEHARRMGCQIVTAQGNADAGLSMLRTIRARSGDEPPTESYAETRQWQHLLGWGAAPWRQVEVLIAGKRIRLDFVIGANRRRLCDRPERFRPSHGMVLELQGREFHEGRFEEDHERFALLTRSGFHYVAVTAQQLQRRPASVRATIDAGLRRAGMTPLPRG